MKKYLSLLIALLMSMSLFACSSTPGKVQDKTSSTSNVSAVSYPLTITDALGREVTIDKEPQKVISVAPNITEIIFALGKGDKLIGRTSFDSYPEDVKNVETIGSLTDPNFEKIASLKPDLVIASTYFKMESVKKLEDLNIKVITLFEEESFDGVYKLINNVGNVLNAQKKSTEIVDNMKAKVANVKKKVEGKATPSTYYVVGYGKYGDFAPGKDTFLGSMIKMAGGVNASEDAVNWAYSLEMLIKKNPDRIICENTQGVKEDLMKSEGYKDLTAVKDGKVFTIDKNLVEVQGPRIADGLEELAKLIHPELFK